MVMPKTVLVGEVEKIIEKRGGKLLEKYNLFDIYEGARIKEGFKSGKTSPPFLSDAKDKNSRRQRCPADYGKRFLEDLSTALGIELPFLIINKKQPVLRAEKPNAAKRKKREVWSSIWRSNEFT
ncbi:MAG: hypothetical protein ACLTH3_08410 [Lachnospira sp.]